MLDRSDSKKDELCLYFFAPLPCYLFGMDEEIMKTTLPNLVSRRKGQEPPSHKKKVIKQHDIPQ